MLCKILNQFEKGHSHREFQTPRKRLHRFQEVKQAVNEQRLKLAYMH
ncbi:MAG TPA: hypothetical protein VMV13_11190 [Candidatus Binataceae bacterium]|nr:hypothetical protein [Candidatus Binataceae bacterium]